MELAQQIAERVFLERKARKWSRIALARHAGVGKTVIWDIEHAKPTVRLQTLIKVCSVLDLALELHTQQGKPVDPSTDEAPARVGRMSFEDDAIAVIQEKDEELPDYLL